MSHKVEFTEAIRLIKEVMPASQVVVSEGVSLKKAGKEWVGLCPFHAEKTPSLSVNDAKGVYYCRGCQATGDVISFVAKYRGIPVGTAITLLAEHCGIKIIPQRQPDSVTRKSGTSSDFTDKGYLDRLKKLQAQVVSVAHKQLTSTLSDPDHPVTRYLNERQISKDLIDQYTLGFLPKGVALYDQVATVEEKGTTLPRPQWEVLASDIGLLNHNKPESMFQGRLLFPIVGRDGQCIGLSGRVVPGLSGEYAGQPKYINSPESPIFDKSDTLFGLTPSAIAMSTPDAAQCWRRRLRSPQAVLVEGYTDVLRLASCGIYSVAGMGTAITALQISHLYRQVSSVTLLMDGDRAGQKAMKNALLLGFPGLRNGQRLLGRSLPAGSDPDDFFSCLGSPDTDYEESPDHWLSSLKAVHPEAVWLEQNIGETSQPVSLSDQVRIERAMAGHADYAPPSDPFWRLHLVRYLADQTGYETKPAFSARAGVQQPGDYEQLVFNDGDRFWLLRLSKKPNLILDFYRPWANSWWVRDLRRGLLLSEGECPASLRLLFLAGYYLSRSFHQVDDWELVDWPKCVDLLLSHGFPSSWLVLWAQIAFQEDPDLLAMGYHTETVTPDLWEWEFNEWVASVDQALSKKLLSLVNPGAPDI